MSKRIFTVLLVFLALGLQAFAQSKVSGKVTDKAGEPLVGVNILVKGTTNGTMTNADGTYFVSNVGSEAVLVFSSIGFATQEIKAGSQTTINVVLEDDTNFLDEVVFVGYGTARKKDVSGAITSVNYANDKNIVNLPNPNVLSSLSSKVAGFSYSPTSSASGDNTSSMTIRGKNAIPSGGGVGDSNQSVNQPLLVVDGVISYASIQSINTSDIQSVDVLKDASAAAIYGSRAANGVIIITTKKGASSKPVVSFDASVSVSDWSRIPERVMDDETFLKNRFYTKVALDDAYKGRNWSDYSSLKVAAAELLNSTEIQAFDKGIKTDWIDEISRKGVGQKYNLSVSGKEKNIGYYVSGNYTRQQGIRLGDDYEKFNVLAKMDINVTDWLTVGIKGDFLHGKSWGQTARIQNATWMSPYSFTNCIIPGYESWNNSKPDGNSISPLWGTGAGDSYLWTDRTSTSGQVHGLAYAQIDFPFIPGLSYRVSLQGQYNTSNTDVFSNPEIWVSTETVSDMNDPSQFANSAGGSISFGRTQNWNVDNLLTYTKDLGQHHMDFMVGYTREASTYESSAISFEGFTTPTYLGVYSVDAAATVVPSRGHTGSQAVGYLARANYNYAGKYFATFNFRRDGFSAFAVGNKWSNFYGASAAWVLSNEDFIKSLNAFDFLKLRLSWGQNGNRSVSPYQTTASIASSSANNGAITYTWLDNKSAYGVAPQNIPNNTLTWATVEKYNLGIDFSVLGSRLNGSVDLYMGKTKDMLMTRSAPYMSGFTQTYDNVGRVTNDGIEITLNSVNFDGDGKNSFRWESNLVFDSNRNCVKELYGPDWQGKEADDVANAMAYGFDSYYALMVGHPIGAAYDLKKIGIFQNEEEVKAYTKNGEEIMPGAKPGDLKFEDTNGDGKITDDDRQFIGSPDPLFTLNLGNTLSWKNFSLYFNFRWAQGDKEHFLWFDPNAFGTSFGSGAQLAATKPWTKENTSTDYPRYGYSNSYNYLFWNQRSYLKLKDLSFSYTFDQPFVKNLGLSNARLYVAATDLFTITGWSGLDPESAGTIAAGASSSRYGSNGTYKTVTFGVNLTF